MRQIRAIAAEHGLSIEARKAGKKRGHARKTTVKTPALGHK